VGIKVASIEAYVKVEQGNDIAAVAAQVVFGWPAIVLALVLLGAGPLLRKDKLLLAGVLASTGFCLYLTAANFLLGPVVYASNWASWYFLRRKARGVSIALLAPFVFVTLYFAIAVLSQ